MHAEGDLVVAVRFAGNDMRKVVEDSLVKAMHDGKAMRRCQIDPRIPFGGAAFVPRCA
jgi:hypothetical protein